MPLLLSLLVCTMVVAPQDTTTKLYNLEATVKVETLTRTVQKGDTLVFNAAAFRVSEDAEASALLMKMPGVLVDGNRITAQGEDIKKVYVDGMEYFGGDIGQVLQVIPASCIKNIEIYNRLSDDALQSGIDDGNGGKVINIITKGDFAHSLFGRLNGGAGVEPDADLRVTEKAKYTGGGFLNRFDGDRRFSVLTLVNNVDKQNLSDESGMEINTTSANNASSQFSVSREAGVGKSQIVAFSYSDKFGKPFREGKTKKKPFTFDGTLFYIHDNIRNASRTDRFYNEPVASDTILYRGITNPDFHVMRARARIEYRRLKHSATLVPALTLTRRDAYAENTLASVKYGPSGYYNITSNNHGHTESISASAYARYSYTIKKGEFVQLSSNVSVYFSDSPFTFVSNSGGRSKVSLSEAPVKYSYQSRSNTAFNGSVYLMPSYNRRIDSRHSVNISDKVTYAPKERTLYLYQTDSTYVVTDPAKYKPRSSYDMDGTNFTNNLLLGYKYNVKKGWLSFQGGVTTDNISTHDHLRGGSTSRWFHYPAYSLSTEWKLVPGSVLRVNASSKVGLPAIWDLNDFYNLANTQFIGKGNPDLKPFNEHNFLARYSRSFSDRGVSVMFLVKGKATQNYIGEDVTYNPDMLEVDGAKYYPIRINQRVNLDGFWSAGSEVGVGFPVELLKSNLNLSLLGDYSSRPEKINGEHHRMEKYQASMRATLGSNISKYIDFTLSWFGQYTLDQHFIPSLSANYVFSKTTGSLHAMTRSGLTFNVMGAYTQYFYLNDISSFSELFGHGVSRNDLPRDFGWKELTGNGASDRVRLENGKLVGLDGASTTASLKPVVNYLLCNATIGQKVLGRHGEIQLCVNDIFGTNMKYSRNTSNTYSQFKYDAVLGRYFMVKFIYNIRQYK